MLDFLWNVHQQGRIRALESKVTQEGVAGRELRDALRELGQLRREVDSLTLTTMAVWSILRDRLGVTDEQVMERVKEIDLSDGRMDGKYTTEVVNCPKCRRVVSQRTGWCVYCGA